MDINEIYKKYGITQHKPKAAFDLGDDPKPATKKNPSQIIDPTLVDTKPLGIDITQDGIIPSIVRGLTYTGARAGALVNTAADLVGADPVIDPKMINANMSMLEEKKKEVSERDLTPMRKAQIASMDKEIEKAKGAGMVLPIANKLLDTVTNPDEWTIQGVVETVGDPLNFVGGGAGNLLAKGGTTVMSRTARGVAGGAAENAAVNAIAEGGVALGRGQSNDEAIKAAVGGGIGGTLFGAPIGAISGARYKPSSLDAKLEETIINHESTKEALKQNALMQTPEGYDPEVGVGFTREAVSDMTPDLPDTPEVDHVQMFGAVLEEDLAAAKAEGEVIYAKAYELARQGAKPEQINTYLDNAITPNRDDIALTRSINGGEMTSSRFSGARIFDTLDRTIRTSVDRPDIARTNEELKATLKKNGLNKTLSNAYVEAYAAKDPSLLYEYVMANTADLQAEVKTHIDNRMGEYKMLVEEQKALRWANTVPESAQDLINHPKFAEHLNDRANVSASDARYAQVRTADLALSHENNGIGYETVVQQPAQFDRNYNYDFEMTKKDVADIKAGRWSDELVRRLRNDLDRRDNDPLYNPETPSIRLQREMSNAVGADQALMNMALIDGRAKAMGITTDELIDRSGLSVENMRDFDGAQYVNDLKEAERMFQVGDMAKKFMSQNDNLLKNKMKSEAKEYIPHEPYIDPDTPDGVSRYNDIFGDGIVKTPDVFKDVYFDFSQYKKLDPRYNEHGEDRTNLLGAIKDTLESPQYVVDFDGISMFMKFYKRQGKSDPVRFVGVVKDKNGNAYVTSSHDLYRDSKLMKVFKYGDLVAERLPDGTYVTRTTASPVLAPSGKPEGSGTVTNNSQANEILHQNDTNVKPTLKTLNDTVILKDWMGLDRALKDGKIDAITDRNQAGWVSVKEIDDARVAIKNSTPYMEGDARIYEYRNNHGDMFRIIADKDGFRLHSDRAAGEGKESVGYDYTPQHEDARRLHQKIPDVKLTDNQINGMAELGIAEGDMKSVIYLFKTADASTLPHELMHVFERTLSEVERSAVDDVLKDYAPGTPRKEALARYFEKYLADGEAPTPELKVVFDKFRDWLTSLWENIIHDGSRDFKLTDAHRELYRALLGDREAAVKLSARYDGIVNEQIAHEAEVLFQRSEQTTERLKSLGDRWDDMVDIGFDKVGRALRGVDGDGNLKINPKSSNLLINAGQSIAEWARENVITNGSRTDAYLGVMDQFAQERGYLESEAAAFYKSLKEFDDVAISDPMAPGEMTSHGALLVRALGGDMDPSSLPSSLKPHYDSFRRIIDANAKALIDAGELAPEHAMENYLKRFYQQHIDPDRPLSVGKQVMDGKHARADIDFDARRELGQVEDAAYVITRTILDQRLQLTKSMMFQRLTDRVSTDAPRDGFVKVPSSKASDGKTPIYGALAGRYVDRGTLKDLQGMYDFGSALDLIVRGMSPAVDYVKVNMTVKNPGTHVYNVVSNMTIAALDGHMSEVAQVINMAVNDKPKFEKLVKMANKMGMNSMLADMEADLAQKLGKGTHPITKIVKNLWAAEGTKMGDAVRAAYDWEDKAFKLAKFYHELKKNNMRIDDASLKSAWDKVNEVYVDHTTRLPKAIRNMDKSGIYPFMGYAWRSAPQVAKLVAKHPLKVAMLQTLMGSFGWSQIALMNQMFGYDDEKDPDAPGYTEGGVNMYGIKNYVKIGDDGKVAEYLNIGRAVPGMRFLPDKGNPYLLYMDGGFLLSILGATAGVSTHGKIYEEYDSNAMKAAKAASKISEYIVPPVAPFVVPISSGDALTATGGVKENSDGSAKTETVSVGARYAQKLIQAANGSVDRYSQPIEVSDVLAQAVGAKTLKVDKEMERSSKLKDLMQELKRAISVDDSDRVEELAAEIRNLDLPDTKLTKPKDDDKKSEDKDRKKKVDDELNRLGLAPKKKSPSIILPSFKPIVPKLDI